MTVASGYYFPEAVFSGDQLTTGIQALVLITARIRSFFFLSPFIGSRSMPRLVRLGLVMALATMAVPATYTTLQDLKVTAFLFIGLLGLEMVLGIFLGTLIWLPIRGLEVVGVIFDTQRGATTGEDFDVIFNAQTTPTAILIAQIFSGYFFANGGFLVITWLLMDSFILWPPGTELPPMDQERAMLFVRMAGALFFSAVLIALPIAGFMFMGDVAVALIARVAPTLNALAFAMPVKSAILLIMLAYYVEMAFPVVFESFSDALSILQQVLKNE